MALSARDQLKYWSVAAVVFAVVLWLLGDVLLPFVLGGAIAYFLDPVADRLERLGFSRIMATAIITVVGLLAFILLLLWVIPSLVNQALDLFDVAPTLFANLRDFLIERFPDIMDMESPLRQSLMSIGETIQSRGGELLNTVLSSAAGIINIVMLFVIVPVVAVYLLLDWDNMVARIDELLPRDHAPTIRKLASDIDRTLASFIRGMGTVCIILGTYYAVALMMIGLQFGLVVGFVAGLVTFIPYLGALIGGALAIGLALFQFWGDWLSIGLVAGVFVLGQVVEGNVLTPKLVGSSVGLHPVWLILALSIFGTLFGFVGMLVAVPVAASIGVIARFAAQQYLQSRLYRGLSDRNPE
ncbi:AI-2E family transporter [Marivita sp. XM-24bin2]|jgi:predicted PurR-regulated permease PerM|uniref:AI-2E family transporter n=1 Tax=unclassified Marivita TaxID=2632480 RepID=UPI000D7A4DE5|nr:AI-2E family transporter [Marivita sp. XM-24bin2]MCR9109847.1 AI-2E family transporter [Paracoccaceae bacterium]PWL36666.1 MAG: AI-2E family transporter [Marivita sp. XM-24bin2]